MLLEMKQKTKKIALWVLEKIGESHGVREYANSLSKNESKHKLTRNVG